MFLEKVVFYHILEALDRKHIAMKCPANGECINYIPKAFHSLVLMAFVDSNYKLLYVNIGAEGSGSDGGAFHDTSLFKAIKYDRS